MYIARQPIFNSEMKVYGYELLFRVNSDSKKFDGVSAVQATASVLTGLFESGIDKIVENKKAFINFNAELLKMDLIELIEPSRLVIEVLEDVEVDETLVNRVGNLKNRGYQIALDDFVESYKDYPLVSNAAIIKYDLMATPLETIGEAVKEGLRDRKILLAEKIETEEEFCKAKEMGFSLFQGYFFSRPSIIGKENKTKTTTKTQYMRLIEELQKEEPSYQHLAEIIEKDVNLSYRLMRVISVRAEENSIYSIKKALTYMGLKELERWIHVLMIQELGADKPKELIQLSLIRSKFSEGIAALLGHKNMKHEAALMGLFSTIDALMDSSMEEALEDVSISNRIKHALVRGEGDLSGVLQTIKSYENGEWSRIDELAEKLLLNPEDIYHNYLRSVDWAKNTMEKMQ